MTLADHVVLDWRPRHDPRSLRFTIADHFGTDKPLRKRSWTRRQWLNQGREGACFPAGTFIRLADGSQKTIETVRLLDEVVTAEGRTGCVVQTMARRTDGLVAVRLRGHIAVQCTPEHPILTQHGYVPAGDLVKGDKVAVTRYGGRADLDPIDTTRLVDAADFRGIISGIVNTGGVVSEIAPIPTLLGRSPALGRLLGLYAAEGHTTANKVTWSYGSHEAGTLVPETVDLIKTVFGAVARIQVRPNRAINVVLYGKIWRRLFETLVPGTSKHGDKYLSGHITGGPCEYRRALLDGWLAGDGHRRRTEYAGVSVSRQLALDMHAIANDLGLAPSSRSDIPSMNRYALSRQTRYTVGMPLGGGTNGPAVHDTATWRSVAEVAPVPFVGWVFNLHVEGDASYVADGLGVHNCTGFAAAHVLGATPRPRPNVTDELARELYHEAQMRDEWPGSDYEGSSVLGAMQALRDRGWITAYYWARTVNELAHAVAQYGPCEIGVPWYESMFTPDAEGLLHVNGSVAGGHAIAVGAVDPAREQFRLDNSWGRDYGVNGSAYLSFDDMARLLAEDGEAALPRKVRA